MGWPPPHPPTHVPPGVALTLATSVPTMSHPEVTRPPLLGLARALQGQEPGAWRGSVRTWAALHRPVSCGSSP